MGCNLLINGIYWGYNPLTNQLLISGDIQVGYTIGIGGWSMVAPFHMTLWYLMVFGYLGFLRRNECIAKEIVVNTYFLCMHPSITGEMIQFDHIWFKVWCMNASDTTFLLTCGDGHSKMPCFLFQLRESWSISACVWIYYVEFFNFCVKKSFPRSMMSNWDSWSFNHLF